MQLVNGEVATTLALDDRSIQFGNGVFRTMRKAGGEIRFWQAHYLKLKHDASVIGIVCPEPALLETDLAQLSLPDAAIKIILLRRNTIRGDATSLALPITRIVQANPLPEGRASWLTDGVHIRFADWRLSTQPRLAGIKHLNRLDSMMARQEWSEPEIVESLMLDQDGWVIEGMMSNLFVLHNGMLLTPDLTRCGVAGVMRDKVIEAAQRLGFVVMCLSLTPDNILEADALLLTNSLFGVVPVRQCGTRVWDDFALCHALHQTIFVDTYA